MQNILLMAGLVLLPFIHIPGWDNRELKFQLASFFALAISLNQIWNDGLKGTKNVWILLLLGYLFIQPYFMPIFRLSIVDDIKTNAFWIYRPILSVVIFFLFYLALTSIKFLSSDIKNFFITIEWVCFILALYGICQYFGIDQFFAKLESSEIRNTPSSQVMGTFLHPILYSTFLAMCVPILIHRKSWRVFIVILAIFLSKSMMGFLTLFSGIVFYLAATNFWVLTQALTVIVAFTIPFWDLILKICAQLSSGRTGIWEFIWRDFTHPIHFGITKTYAMTGNGLGSFSVIYPGIHGTSWAQAHNDYLEFMYNAGIIGLFLLGASIFILIKPSFQKVKTNFELRAILASFLASCVSAFGTFNWQMGAHIFYTLFLAGMITNLTREN